MDQLLREAKELTFKPATNPYPGAQASLQIRCPETCTTYVQMRQKQHMDSLRAKALRKEVPFGRFRQSCLQQILLLLGFGGFEAV